MAACASVLVQGASASPVLQAKIRIPRLEAMSRERLLRTLAPAWHHRLTLLVAPAGCGKTVALSQFARAAHAPVAWYTAEADDREAGVLLAHLEAATRSAVGRVEGPWRCVVDAAHALERMDPGPLLLVVDDLHTLQGTPASEAFERLLHYLTDGVTVVAGSRCEPSFDLSRLRLAGTLLEVPSDALRFRSWEVERLFAHFYGAPLRPEDLAELARRTEGWAAGLQLFHLATRGKAPEGRRSTLSALGSRSRLVREYLARNILDGLDERTRSFLLSTAVLGRLSGPLCDRLLGRRGSGELLADLERRQLFTQALDDDGWYRYHEVLRSHLETVAVETMGQEAVREQRLRAAALLEADGWFADALEVYCKAGASDAAERVLGVGGERVVAEHRSWIDLLPSAVVDRDGWAMLAAARRHRAAGRWQSAAEAYRRAELAGGSAAELGRRERSELAVWMEPAPRHVDDWLGLLRRATRTDPLDASRRARRGTGPGDFLAQGLAALLAGRLHLVRPPLLEVVSDEHAGSAVRLCARLGAALSRALGEPQPDGSELDAVVDEAERAGFPWLAGLGRGALTLVGDRPDGGGADAEGGEEDRWGPALCVLFRAWGELRRGPSEPGPLETAVSWFHALDARVLETWASALLALAVVRRGVPGGHEVARQAEAMARSLEVAGARAFALLALGEVEPGAGHHPLALRIARDGGLALPRGASTEADPEPPTDSAAPTGDAAAGARPATAHPATPAPSVSITCLGAFTLEVRGRPVDLSTVKPRARSLLRMLALHAGRPVHREVLSEALWPEADYDTGTRNLHVAISSLRHALPPDGSGASAPLLVRDGEAYRLALAADARVDMLDFDASAAAGRTAYRAGAVEQALEHLHRALDLCVGEILPEEGPSDWVVRARERHATRAVEAAFCLATLCAGRGEVVSAAQACERGLQIDRDRDELWRLLIAIHEGAGDHVTAARVQQRYAERCEELSATPS